MEPETDKPTWRERIVGILTSVPFPLGLGVIAFGVWMIFPPAGVIAAGVFTALIGWAVEQ